MATMLEVAKRAGVSKATVSRVLSGNGYVSQETKDRVFKAVAESGYRPNLLARNLATKTTQTLGLVVTNTLYHGVYFSELLYHVARMTEDKGRQLILADGKHSAQEEREAIQYLLDLRCDAQGVLTLCGFAGDYTLELEGESFEITIPRGGGRQELRRPRTAARSRRTAR